MTCCVAPGVAFYDYAVSSKWGGVSTPYIISESIGGNEEGREEGEEDGGGVVGNGGKWKDGG